MWPALAVIALTGPSCAGLKQISDAVINLSKVQFKLDGVSPGTLAGVDLSKVNSPSRLGTVDALKLATAFAENSWPLSFTLNVAAQNPNHGGSENNTALLSALAWTLHIDGKETVSGDIPEPLEIPGAGQTTLIPLQMSLDLVEFFGEKGYQDLLNLGLAIAGSDGSASRLTLTAVPTISIRGIPVRYPGALTIVDTEFSGKD